mgnify:CR=1 FL=1
MRNRIIEQDLKEIIAEDLPWERLRDTYVLVTGGSGILAAYIVETLLYLNEMCHLNIHIIAIVRNLKKARRRFAYYKERNDLIIYSHDIRYPLSMEEPIEYIFHAAGQASPKFYGCDPVGTIEGHILGTRNCLLLAREKGVKGMLQFSSCDSYGERFSAQEANVIDESFVGQLDSLADRSCYSMGKAVSEYLCHIYALAEGIPVKIVRIAHTYAPLMPLDDGRVFADFIGNALRGEDIALNSDGSAERPMLYITDAIRAYFRVLFLGKLGDAYNVAAEENTSIYAFAKLVAGLAPCGGLHVTVKKEERKGYLQAPKKQVKISIRKLQSLGYRQAHTLVDGMRRVLQSYEEKENE